MVRGTAVLARIPAIKFRKGGVGTPTAQSGAAPAAAGANAQAHTQQTQQTSSMSTGAIYDYELPARYQRRPLSQEEIDHINGGGIKDKDKPEPPKTPPQALAVFKIPRGVLIETGKKQKQVMALNIVLQKPEKNSNV